MNKYEVPVVLSAKLEDDQRAEVIDRIKGYIERYNGVVGEIDEWGKKRLAYEINRETEAYYYIINFESGSECPVGLESELRIMESVLRYLVVKKEN